MIENSYKIFYYYIECYIIVRRTAWTAMGNDKES